MINSGFNFGTNRFIVPDRRYLVVNMEGIPTANPYIIVLSNAASYILATAVGAGCSGKNPCVIEREASIDKPIYSKGNLVLFARAIAKVTNMINPTV